MGGPVVPVCRAVGVVAPVRLVTAFVPHVVLVAGSVIALSAVIRGSTPHFDFVAGAAANGCAKAMMETGVPVLFGVLTTDTIEQAIERSGTKAGNKGWDSAMAALEMMGLGRALASDGL